MKKDGSHYFFFLAKLRYRTLSAQRTKTSLSFPLKKKKNPCPWYLWVGQLEQFMVTSKPLWRWDDKFLRQPETGQRAFSCYFLVFIFAGLTSLSTRTTPEHNISCDGLQSWQTEKQHEKSPFLQHFHHKLSRSLPNLSKHRVVWGVLSNQTFLGVCVCSQQRSLHTEHKCCNRRSHTNSFHGYYSKFLTLFFSALSTQSQSGGARLELSGGCCTT